LLYGVSILIVRAVNPDTSSQDDEDEDEDESEAEDKK